MRYSDVAAINELYALIAELARPEDPELTRLDDVMVIAFGLTELGEDRSWASVWWAYGALHYEMSDAALETALELLSRVDASREARAAALMLRAEIKQTQAAYQASGSSPTEQRALLAEAVSLAPDWPALRLRLARASKAVGEDDAARANAAEALALLASGQTQDPFDSALSGKNLDRAYVEQEVQDLGLTATP